MRGRFSRRDFMAAGIATPLLSAAHGRLPASPPREALPDTAGPAAELSADLVIVGGGLGGCAAALAACRRGLKVVLTEETDWVGGQLTAQAVPLDENRWIETVAGTRGYDDLRRKVREYYVRNFPLTAEARANPRLNPGNGNVSALCHEPRVGLAVLEEMLAAALASGRLSLLLRRRAIEAAATGDLVEAVRVRSEESGRELVLHAPFFVDATELGDLLPLAGAEFVTGAESQAVTGEPHAKPEAQPANQQAFTCCFAMDYVEGEDHVVEKPRDYDFWRRHVPSLAPPWPGRLLSLVYTQPRTLQPFDMGFDPARATGLFRYRRIVDRANFEVGAYAGDMTLVNWPQNDYMLGNLVGVAPEEAARHLDSAKQLSLSLLYWLQTECPRPDGGEGWKGLRLRPDVVGTEDGLAKHPYVRESRRIEAEFTVFEQHVSAAGWAGAKDARLPPARFADSVGIGSYALDLHPTSGGDNYLDLPARPFEIPLGALLPRRVENLLPACKNIGTTHLSNGCFRLHPVEWNVGESVGELAAFCRVNRVRPRAVRHLPRLLADFQRQLVQGGVRLSWPAD